MVFWSGFIKKIKNGVNQLAFEALKTKVETIEATYGTITYIDTKNNELRLLITDNTNDITQIKNELQQANFVIYKGNWNGGITYRTGEATTYNNKWYVSNVDNNLNHIPTGASDQYWELISEPTINLNDYYTKLQADAKFALIGESYTKTQSDQKYALLSNTYTQSQVDSYVRQLNTQIDTVRDSTNRLENNLNTNYYTKTETNNTFYNKTYIDNFCTNWKVVRVNWRTSGHQVSSRGNPGYGWTKYGWLTLPTELGGNLGRVRHVVFRVNSDTWTMTGWAINVYSDRLDVAMTRLTIDNQDWDANSMEFDIYYL